MLPPDSPARASAVLGRASTALGVSCLLLAAGEWEHYRRLIQWGLLPISTWDRGVLAWTLLAKTLLLLLVPLAASALLELVGRRRLATLTWLCGAGGVLVWLVVDLRVHSITNNHLLTYLGYLSDPEAWQWAGGAAGIFAKVLAIVAVAGLAVAVLDRCALRLAAKCLRAWPWLGRRLGLGLLASILCLSALGVLPAYRGVTCPVAVERLRAALPWDPLGRLVAGGCPGSDAERTRVELNRQMQSALERRIEALRRPGAVDRQIVPLEAPPHVVIFVLESLRYDLWPEGRMPRLSRWAEQGLVLDRHYAGGNCSHLGVFGLLYARSTILYHNTLDAGIPPQACATLRAAGYECSYMTSATVTWMRMHEFIRRGPFDRVVTDERPDWVAGDRAILALLREQLRRASRPQFIVCFLDSTHFPYLYPPEFARHAPVLPADAVPSVSDRKAVANRYHNAALFLDHEVAETIAGLDPARHLIVVTGDHGESHFDDGTLTHSGLLSEIQCRTVLGIVGPGIPQRRIAQATTHADVLPTLLHALAGRETRLANTQGRDLLAGPIEDEVLIATTKDNFWDAMLVQGDKRLSLQISLHEPRVRSLGYLGCDGKFDPRETVAAADADGWAALAEEHFDRLSGSTRRDPQVMAASAKDAAGLRR